MGRVVGPLARALAIETGEDEDGGLLARAASLAPGEVAKPVNGLGGDGDRDRVHHDRSVAREGQTKQGRKPVSYPVSYPADPDGTPVRPDEPPLSG